MPQHAASLYQPLTTSTSTRVLTLLPGADDTAIAIRLREVDLRRSPKYEAISYTWGSEGNEQTIYVDDKLVEIRHNLYRFLFRLRQRSRKPRTLWIDAISISQIDLDEKRQQVAIIGKIFSSAGRVLIWLGEHADGSEYLFRPGLIRATVALRSLYDKLRPLSEDQKQVRAVQWGELLNRDYWKRTWVVQEIYLAKCITVHCGDDWQYWNRLTEHGFTFGDKDHHFDGIDLLQHDRIDELDSFLRKVDLHVGVHNLYSLHQRMSRFRRYRLIANETQGCLAHILLEWLGYGLECSDRRDYVYALLSLSTDQTSVQPDYRIGMPELLLRVYKQLVEYESLHRGYDSGICTVLCNIVLRLIRNLDLTVAELRGTLQITLSEGPRTNLISGFTWLAPILFGIMWNLHNIVGEEGFTIAAADILLERLRTPTKTDAEAGFAELEPEATLLIEAMGARENDG